MSASCPICRKPEARIYVDVPTPPNLLEAVQIAIFMTYRMLSILLGRKNSVF
jgi:hypothetical protein